MKVIKPKDLCGEKKEDQKQKSTVPSNDGQKMATPPILAPPPYAGGDDNRHKIGVTLCYFDSPGNFYLRTEDTERMFVKLSTELGNHFGSKRYPHVNSQ